MYGVHHQADKNRRAREAVVTSNRSTLQRNTMKYNVILMMEAILSSETSVLTRTTRRNIIGDAALHRDNCLLPASSHDRFMEMNSLTFTLSDRAS
jgi:hypothetical protein